MIRHVTAPNPTTSLRTPAKAGGSNPVAKHLGRWLVTLAALALGCAARATLAHQPTLAFILAACTLIATPAALILLARHNDRPSKLAAPLLFGLLILWLWEMLVIGLHIPFILLPPPSAIARAFAANLGTLAIDFDQTYLHAVLIGYAIGCATGFLAALAIDRSPFLKRGLTPFASMVSAMPIVGIAPIAIMWFGFGWPSKAAVVTLMTVLPHADQHRGRPRPSRRLRARPDALLRRLLLANPPQTPPARRATDDLHALKLNSTLALIGAVVAEFFGTPTRGMGFRISTESAAMNLDIVWATITVAALAGSISFGLLAWAERVVTFWHPSFHKRAD